MGSTSNEEKEGAFRGRSRLRPEERREQLIRVASSILATKGGDGVRIPQVAAAAGVTRPVVYKFFPNRQALLIAILEEFAIDLEERFQQGFLQWETLDLPHLVRGFVEATCESIEARGPGAWYLMGSPDADPEIVALAHSLQARLSEPWLKEIALVTGAAEKEVRAVGEMIIASCRAILGLWIAKQLSRSKTLDVLMRGVTALLREFSTPN